MPLQRHLVYPATLAFHASILQCENSSLLVHHGAQNMKAGNSQVLKALQVTFWFL